MRVTIILIFCSLFFGQIIYSQKDTHLFPANYAKNGKAGFIDQTGKVVIPFQFDEVTAFSEGLAAVRIETKWGYINKSGKQVIPAQFEAAYPFSYGIAKVYTENEYRFINQSGTIVPLTNFEYNEFSDGMIKITQAEKYGFADHTGKIVVPADYDEAIDFSEGIGYGRIDGTYTFFDKSGKMLFETTDVPIGSFSEGLIQVKIGNSFGFLDKTGQLAIPANFQYRNNSKVRFSDGMAVFEEGPGYYDYKVGAIDKSGKVLIKPIFSHISDFHEGMAVFAENKEGYIDKTGKIIVPAEFENAFRFSEGFAIAIRGLGGGKYQYELLDTKGQIIKTFDAYEGIREETYFVNGLCKLHQTVVPSPDLSDENMRQWGGVRTIYINPKGDVVWQSEPWYSCFPAGVLVLMADYKKKPIEKIKPGDQILSYDFANQKITKSTVYTLDEHKGNYPLIEVFYSNNSELTASDKHSGSAINSIKLTANHPVATKNGFKPAGSIVPGEEIYSFKSGKTYKAMVIESIKDKIYTKQVFNLVISGSCYFVDGVLVMMK